MRWMIVFLVLVPRIAFAQSELERARSLYNAGRYEESITAATRAASRPALANSARLILARAHLEQFRQGGDANELSTARTTLLMLKPAGLAPQEAVEWQVGVATALFLEDQLGPAAEIFTTLLPSARARLTPEQYEKLLDWWGTAFTRFAESLTGQAKTQMYEKLLRHARSELERNAFSGPATYWTVVASRGVGDLEAAWNAAVTGWIRLSGEANHQKLQADLDAFVTKTLIPERAQVRTGGRLDAEPAVGEIAALRNQWRAVTSRWSVED